LGVRLDSELVLRVNPWQEVSAAPKGFPRMADTFPISGAYSKMRWQPGDGVRLSMPDINVEDATPRQIIQVTRAFGPNGRTGTQAGFRQRPRSPAHALRNQVGGLTRSQRSFQGQYITRVGTLISESIAAGALSAGFSGISLNPQEKIVSAVLRISANTTAATIGVYMNGVNQSAILGGFGGIVPMSIPLSSVVAPDAFNQIYTQILNSSGGASVINFQLTVITIAN
jgi:hypothetical protein